MLQYSYPVSDIENPGRWATEPLWDKIDEEPFDDVDFLTSPKTATGDSFTIGLSGVIDPQVHADHIIRIRAKTGVSGTFKFELLQGAVVIKDSGDVVLSTTFAEYNMLLTEEEAGNISDYGAFRVRVTAISTQKNQRQNVSWIRFECPDTGGEEHSGSGSISGNGTVAGSVKKGAIGSAVKSAGGTLLAIGLAGMLGIASIVGGGTQLAVGKKSVLASAFISGGGSVVASGEAIVGTEEHSGIAAISGNGILSGTGIKQALGDSVITGGGSVSASGEANKVEEYSGIATITGGGVLVGLGTKSAEGISVISGNGIIRASGEKETIIKVVKTVFLKSRLTERVVELKSTIKPLIVLNSEIKPEGEE